MEIVEYRMDGSLDQHRSGQSWTWQLVHGYLSRSYWAKDIPLVFVKKAIEHSLCFGVYDEESGAQVGFARVISDYATYSYLADVFILEEYRGRGLSKWLMQCILDHPELQWPRTFFLATRDAQASTASWFRSRRRPRAIYVAPKSRRIPRRQICCHDNN